GRFILARLLFQPIVSVERMQLAFEFLLICELSAGGHYPVLRLDMDRVRTDRLGRTSGPRSLPAPGSRCLEPGPRPFEVALLLWCEIARHHAAFRSASARPKMMSSRIGSMEPPPRMRSTYQRPSAVSPNSTAPTRRPFASTSFL